MSLHRSLKRLLKNTVKAAFFSSQSNKPPLSSLLLPCTHKYVQIEFPHISRSENWDYMHTIYSSFSACGSPCGFLLPVVFVCSVSHSNLSYTSVFIVPLVYALKAVWAVSVNVTLIWVISMSCSPFFHTYLFADHGVVVMSLQTC